MVFNFGETNAFRNVGIHNLNNELIVMNINSSSDNISFHSTTNDTNVDIMSIKTILNKDSNNDLNISSFNGTQINPVIKINNTEQHVNITSNLNVLSNLNVSNNINSDNNIVKYNLIVPKHSQHTTTLDSIEGSIYYNTNDNLYYSHNHEEWLPLGGINPYTEININHNLNVLSNLNVSNNINSDNNIVKYNLIVPKHSQHTTTLDSIAGSIYYNTNDNLYYSRNHEEWLPLGGINPYTEININHNLNVLSNLNVSDALLHINNERDQDLFDNKTLLLLETISNNDCTNNEFLPSSIDFKHSDRTYSGAIDNTTESRISSVMCPGTCLSSSNEGEKSSALIFSTQNGTNGLSENMRIGPNGIFSKNSCFEVKYDKNIQKNTHGNYVNTTMKSITHHNLLEEQNNGITILSASHSNVVDTDKKPMGIYFSLYNNNSSIYTHSAIFGYQTNYHAGKNTVGNISFNFKTNTENTDLDIDNQEVAYTAGTYGLYERFTFTHEGKLGIGTTNPEMTLDVRGDTQIIGAIQCVIFCSSSTTVSWGESGSSYEYLSIGKSRNQLVSDWTEHNTKNQKEFNVTLYTTIELPTGSTGGVYPNDLDVGIFYIPELADYFVDNSYSDYAAGSPEVTAGGPNRSFSNPANEDPNGTIYSRVKFGVRQVLSSNGTFIINPVRIDNNSVDSNIVLDAFYSTGKKGDGSQQSVDEGNGDGQTIHSKNNFLRWINGSNLQTDYGFFYFALKGSGRTANRQNLSSYINKDQDNSHMLYYSRTSIGNAFPDCYHLYYNFLILQVSNILLNGTGTLNGTLNVTGATTLSNLNISTMEVNKENENKVAKNTFTAGSLATGAPTTPWSSTWSRDVGCVAKFYTGNYGHTNTAHYIEISAYAGDTHDINYCKPVIGTNFSSLYFRIGNNVEAYITTAGVLTASFTGQHRSKIISNEENGIEDYIGMIVVSTGEYNNLEINENKLKPTINESLPIVELSKKKKDKSVFGVLSNYEDNNSSERTFTQGNFVSVFKKQHEDNRVYINSLGEGAIWVVNTNGNLENGDYIQSSTIIGHGEKQDDDILHNYTVAKITCVCNFDLNSIKYDCIEFVDSTSGNTYRKAFVGCTYHCG